MDAKEFKTYKEQQLILEKRDLLIQHPRSFVNIMRQESYYNVINGYKKYFIASMNPEKYIKGVTFEQIYSLYMFDQDLRALFMLFLLKIEKSIKALLSYHFSEAYGYDHRRYLDICNFNSGTQKNIKKCTKLINDIYKDIAYYNSHQNNAIVHYSTKYQYIPLWVLTNIFTFGRTDTFYSRMKLPDQQKISAHFKLSASEFEGFIYFLADYRNRCAHGERIYTSNNQGKYLKFIPDTKWHHTLIIPRNSQGNYIGCKSDVMALFIALKTFLKQSEFTSIKKTFIKKEKLLANKIPKAIMQNIDREMGTPSIYLPLIK